MIVLVTETCPNWTPKKISEPEIEMAANTMAMINPVCFDTLLMILSTRTSFHGSEYGMTRRPMLQSTVGAQLVCCRTLKWLVNQRLETNHRRQTVTA